MNHKKLTLSLVIPVYNEERYLAACLAAAAAQTVQPDEIIVIDNNSTDATARLLKERHDIKFVTEPTQGVYFARARGFNEADSDIIARIDADTLLPADWVEKVLAHFSEPMVAAVTGPVSYYDMPFPSLSRWFDHHMRKYTYEWSPESPFLYGSNMAMRRSAWQLVAPQECEERNIHEDVDLAIHLYKSGQKIIYDRRLIAGASGRRMNETPFKFIRYVWMYQRTFHNHGLFPAAAYSAMFMWLLGYCLVHPWLKYWYRLYGALHPGRPVTRGIRKNPMADTLNELPTGSKLDSNAES